ncbi:MAG: GTPase [Thermodesulfobacteriota bacterium]
MKKRVLIMGAAGRDFHNFNCLFRDDPSVRVVAFTAAQIPYITDRTYPPLLAGPLYPEGIPIHPEERLAGLLGSEHIDTVVFSYSDVSFGHVMRLASVAASQGAGFTLPGPGATMLESTKPVISVTAVRTGCGKSGTTRFVAGVLREAGLVPVVIRHPMPYGDLAGARVQRFASPADLEAARCTIEEREEYEPLVEAGYVVYAGVDYRAVLDEAEEEGDVVVWDGGNNDGPFIRPDLDICLADALRPGAELGWWPGEANLRRAGVVVVAKADAAPPESSEAIIRSVRAVNPGARIIRTASVIDAGGAEAEAALRGRTALVVEDGPTLTHGGMGFGAGLRAAERYGAEAVDARPFARGSMEETFRRYPHIEKILPAMGYSPAQIRDLESTIAATPSDVVIVATPVNLTGLIKVTRPVVRVRYEVEDMETPGLRGVVMDFIDSVK